MCLAIPGKILSIKGESAVIDFCGVQKEINVSLVKAKKDNFVMVHTGFAIGVLSKNEAKKTLNAFKDVVGQTSHKRP